MKKNGSGSNGGSNGKSAKGNGKNGKGIMPTFRFPSISDLPHDVTLTEIFAGEFIKNVPLGFKLTEEHREAGLFYGVPKPTNGKSSGELFHGDKMKGIYQWKTHDGIPVPPLEIVERKP